MDINIGHSIIYSKELVEALDSKREIFIDLNWDLNGLHFHVLLSYHDGHLSIESDIDFNIVPEKNDDVGVASRTIYAGGYKDIAESSEAQMTFYEFVAMCLRYRFAFMLMNMPGSA